MVGAQGALHAIEVASERLYRDLNGMLSSLQQAFGVDAVRPGDGEVPLEVDRTEIALDAARMLMNRLQLRRAAWGPVDGPASLQRIQFLARGLPEHITLDVSGIGDATVFPPSIGRIVLNLLLLTADGLPGGGTVRLAGAADDLFIAIDGPAAAWPAGMAVCLVNETEARAALHEPGSLQMAMTALLARAAGIRLSILLAPATQATPAIIRLGG